jgi:hypothetical protein
VSGWQFGSETEFAKMSGRYNQGGDGGQIKYKGVRERHWGKWVSEIRDSVRRKRIWLGSFRSAEEAAHAYDAALICLRGNAAQLNFPNNIPNVRPPSSHSGNYSTKEIQAEAAQAAANYAGRNFSYNDFISPTISSDDEGAAPNEIADITHEENPRSTHQGATSSYGYAPNFDEDEHNMIRHMASGLGLTPPREYPNDFDDDDDYNAYHGGPGPFQLWR